MSLGLPVVSANVFLGVVVHWSLSVGMSSGASVGSLRASANFLCQVSMFSLEGIRSVSAVAA